MKTLLILMMLVICAIGNDITPMIVSESDGVVNFVVTLDVAPTNTVNLPYTVTPITAMYPLDYTSNMLTGKLRFMVNQTTSSMDIVITIVQNAICEDNKTFLITFDGEDFIITIEEDDCQLIFPSPVKNYEGTTIQVVPTFN